MKMKDFLDKRLIGNLTVGFLLLVFCNFICTFVALLLVKPWSASTVLDCFYRVLVVFVVVELNPIWDKISVHMIFKRKSAENKNDIEKENCKNG